MKRFLLSSDPTEGGNTPPANPAPPASAEVVANAPTERELELERELEVTRAERETLARGKKKLETDLAHLQDVNASLKHPPQPVQPAKGKFSWAGFGA